MCTKEIVSRALLCLSALLLTGCGTGLYTSKDSSEPLAQIENTTAATTSAAATTETHETTTVSTTTVQTTNTPPETTPSTSNSTVTTSRVPPQTTTAPVIVSLPPVSETYGDYALAAEDTALLNETVFVGDSICSGLRVYKILPANHVVAHGSVGVRSVYDYKYSVNNGSYELLTALAMLKPKYVVFSMGMNDIHMSSTEKFCNDYDKLLTDVGKILPDAVLSVASITPVTTDAKFAQNTKIDQYNQALSAYLAQHEGWHYLDITPELKNAYNGLKYNYSSGDGVHLAPAAYKAILWQVCAQLRGIA